MAESIALGMRLSTATELASAKGIEGEISVVEGEWRAVVHDGVTKGGYPVAKKSEVDGAIQTANSANSTASAAQTVANEAKNTASSAVTTANGAVTTANTAKTTAEGAVKTANTASTNASSAKTSAESAVSTANTAKTTAEGAVSTANTAKSTADTAKSTADSALAKANKAVQKVNGVAPGTDGNVEIEIPSSVHVGASAPTDADTSVWIDTDEADGLAVTSVNGKSANESGVVTISASDVGALPTTGGRMTGVIEFPNGASIYHFDTPDWKTLEVTTDGAALHLRSKDSVASPSTFDIQVMDSTSYKSLSGGVNTGLVWDGKQIVRSVNGAEADADGNVTISVGGVSQKLNTTVTVNRGANSSTTQTISGLVANKPLYIAVRRTDNISGAFTFVYVSSGTVANTTTTNDNRSITLGVNMPHWFTVVPTGTTVALTLKGTYDDQITYSVVAYQ